MKIYNLEILIKSFTIKQIEIMKKYVISLIFLCLSVVLEAQQQQYEGTMCVVQAGWVQIDQATAR